MDLRILGAGMGRTGTLSLKAAIEQLGLGPCYHMTRIFEHPEHPPLWQRFATGERTDWETLLGDYPAAVDWPASFLWRELAAYYPQAKVVLTVRDPQRWFESINNTLFHFMKAPTPVGPEAAVRQIIMARDLIQQRLFGNRLDDRDHVIRTYLNHNAAVQAAIPASRLLVFDVAQGWGPLCQFLGVPIPDTPFPRVNAQEEVLATYQPMYDR